jgi:AcrR family transcriptional regulator
VLDAAAQVFRQKGYIGTRLSDIADVAGIQGGSLYYHFSSRDALAEEVLLVGQIRTLDMVRDRIDDLPEGARPIDRLRAAIIAQGAAVLEVGDYTSATIRMLPQVPENIRRRTVVAQKEFAQDWDRLLKRARAAGEIRQEIDLHLIRMLMMGALNSAVEWYHPGGGLSGEELAEQVADVFLHGLSLPDRRSEAARSPQEVGNDAAPEESGQVGKAGGAHSRGAATRLRILDAAAKTFQEKGYAGTRLTDIASAAGLRTASLYYHFESRDDLVKELMRVAWEHTNDFVRRCVEHLPPEASETDRIAVAMSAHLVSALQVGTRTAAVIQIMGQVPEEVRRESLADQREYLGYWRDMLSRAVKGGEFRSDLSHPAMLMMVMGALNWTVAWYDQAKGPRPEEVAAQLATMMIDGLAR